MSGSHPVALALIASVLAGCAEASDASEQTPALASTAPAAGSSSAGERLAPMLPPGSPDSAVIAAIEAEGSRFPRDSIIAPYPPYDIGPLLAERGHEVPPLVGTDARECVTVPTAERSSVRSGEFVIGGQLTELIHGRPRKLWWRPVNSRMDMTLLVRGRLLDAAGDTVRFESSEVVAPLDSDTHEPYAEEAFFPSGISFPSAGNWAVVATSGRNWGCFIFAVT